MKLDKAQLIILGIVAFVLIFFVLIFLGVIPGLKTTTKKTIKTVDLSLWVLGNKNNYLKIVEAFKKNYPDFQINFEIKDFNNEYLYKKNVFDALAAGKGPDIFMIKSTDIFRDLNKLTPVNKTKYNLISLKKDFPLGISEDVVYNNEIYGLPLDLDNLALIFNRDLFNQAGIVYPPTNWPDFKKAVSLLVRKNQIGDFERIGAAIGGSEKNIKNSTDILMALILQKILLANDSKNNFLENPQFLKEAIQFYTDFFDYSKDFHTWKINLDNDFDLFLEGKLGMIFGYYDDYKNILKQNPQGNYEVSFFPQFNQEKMTTFARYWILGVSSQSPNKSLAWDFVLFLTTKPEISDYYQKNFNTVPALNTLINKKINDPNNQILNLYSHQALFAKSLPLNDYLEAKKIFSQTLENFLTGQLNLNEILIEIREKYKLL